MAIIDTIIPTTINYAVDTSTLTINEDMPTNFYCTRYSRKLSVSKILYTYDNSLTTNLSNFKDKRLYSINGTAKTNPWEETEPLNEFYDTQVTNQNFVCRGSYVNFGKLVTSVQQSVGTDDSSLVARCELYIKNNRLYIAKYNKDGSLLSSVSYTASAFSDGIMPRRLIVVMSGAGGGGGSSGGGSSLNGGGGGSGGFFACVLNTEWLWEEKTGSSKKYIFYIGKGGNGGWVNYTQNTGWKYTDGGHGGDSSIVKSEGSNSTTLLCAHGGSGGGSWNNKNGTKGLVTDGNNTDLTEITAINGLNTYFWWLPYSNNRSFEHGKDGDKGKPGTTKQWTSDKYYIYNTSNSALQSKTLNSISVGSYTSGKVSNVNGGGGGAPSYFGNGGNGGGWGSDTSGKDADGYGAGGGGSTYIFILTGGNGGKGSNGMLRIYAYNEADYNFDNL